MKVKGTPLAREYKASTIAASYAIDIDVARELKAGGTIEVDDATLLIADGVAEEVEYGSGS
jgi:hypothetical protein